MLKIISNLRNIHEAILHLSNWKKFKSWVMSNIGIDVGIKKFPQLVEL